MSLDDVFDYFRHYDEASFAILSCGEDAPPESELRAFEHACGFRLPDEFRQFTKSPLGGLYLEAREEVWPRRSGGRFWMFLHGVKVFGISSDIPEWLDLRHQQREFASAGLADLVPFMARQGDAERYCFDSSGRVLAFDHETQGREPVGLTFSDLLLREIRALEERTQRMRDYVKERS